MINMLIAMSLTQKQNWVWTQRLGHVKCVLTRPMS